MRLHHLEVTGFGPFADRVRIDFDGLSEAGLFLLSGPTGAGKSSVLDAVCFALYGDVPGDRATAKRLRSDHADDTVVPRVVLEATLSGRRFRIDRSPAWTRPKRRGTGRTTEQARVVISERRPAPDDPDGADQWHPLSTRLDETGHLVTRLVGMTLPQFCQVAMLPQGRFQAFLRARSEDRHALLQQVFATERFDRVEKWLRDRRVALGRASATHLADVSDLASRVSEVAATMAPADWADTPDALTGWIADLATVADFTAHEAAADAAAAGRIEESAAAAVEDAASLAALQTAHATALRAAADLDAASAVHEQHRERLDRARRAAPVRPLHDLSVASRRDERSARRRRDEAARELAQALGARDVTPGTTGEPDTDDATGLDDQQVADLRRQSGLVLTDLARIQPLRDQLRRHDRELDDLVAARESAAAELARTSARAEEGPRLLAGLTASLAAAREAAERATALGERQAVLDDRVRAAESVLILTRELAGAEQALREATEARLGARERLVEIRELRLDGMAAEIALQLAVGGCCPVCGSAEHPAPAAPAPGAPDEAAERSARREVDDLEAVVEAHAQQVRGLETRRAASAAEAGAPLEVLLADRSVVHDELEQARATAAPAAALVQRIDALHDEQADLAARLDTLTATCAGHDTALAVLRSRIQSLGEQVAAVVPDGEDADALLRHHQEVERLAAACLEAGAARAAAGAAADRDEHALAEAAARAGFDSAADASAAWLAPDDVDRLEEELVRHDRAVDRVRAQLDDPALIEAASHDAPDTSGLARALDEARAGSTQAHRRHAGLVERGRRLRALADEVAAALAAWAPLRAEHDLVTSLAAMVEGKHPDNRLQMRLSAYVLTHRLGQVVEAANVRLAAMSDQRYSLVHTGERGAGERRGGLSLLVRDDWTGDSRDPATLSGGETFVVSLALALGLADVITGEAGGADLDTLFVDEGFGSLDAETLEDVMDTLDTLRDGGRVVGVVSHVPELQTRIPTQLRVIRGRHGSRVSLRTT